MLCDQKGKSYSNNDTPTGLKLLTLARDLRRRKSRERRSLFVAEGVRAVEELLASPIKVKGILAAPQLDGAQRGAELRQRIAASGIESAAVTEAEFRSAAETESPQGVLAICEVPEPRLDEFVGRASLRILVLDAVQDPGNVGTILRTASALGVDVTAALPGTVDLWNAKVVRAAMGASFRHPVLHVSLEVLQDFLERNAIEFWGADTAGAPVEAASAPSRLAIAVGNEGAGLSSSVRDRVTRLVSLPISGQVESLNVSVATGILLYHLRK